MELTLKEFINKVKKLSEDYNVWIEGCGDGSFKIVIEEKIITILN